MNQVQGLETPGGYSYSQNDVGNAEKAGAAGGVGEYRTPQSTRCGAKISGLGDNDWGVSEGAHVIPLLPFENLTEFHLKTTGNAWLISVS
jgi:hypothetical protein